MAAAAQEEMGAIEIEIEESGVGSWKLKFEMDKGAKEERGVKRRIQIQIEGFGKLSFETEKAAKKERVMLAFQIQFMNEKLRFEAEKSAPLRRVFQDFYDRLGLAYGTVRFILKAKARCLREDQTPEYCSIQDGDIIEAIPLMLG